MYCIITNIRSSTGQTDKHSSWEKWIQKNVDQKGGPPAPHSISQQPRGNVANGTLYTREREGWRGAAGRKEERECTMNIKHYEGYAENHVSLASAHTKKGRSSIASTCGLARDIITSSTVFEIHNSTHPRQADRGVAYWACTPLYHRFDRSKEGENQSLAPYFSLLLAVWRVCTQ